MLDNTITENVREARSNFVTEATLATTRVLT